MTLYIDGGCTNQTDPDHSTRTMRAVLTDDQGVMLFEKTLPGGSSNIAELWAFVEALRYAKTQGIKAVDVYTDSKNNLAWVRGRVGRKVNDMNAVYNLILAIENLEQHVTYNLTWVPREENLAGIYIEDSEAALSV